MSDPSLLSCCWARRCGGDAGHVTCRAVAVVVEECGSAGSAVCCPHRTWCFWFQFHTWVWLMLQLQSLCCQDINRLKTFCSQLKISLQTETVQVGLKLPSCHLQRRFHTDSTAVGSDQIDWQTTCRWIRTKDRKCPTVWTSRSRTLIQQTDRLERFNQKRQFTKLIQIMMSHILISPLWILEMDSVAPPPLTPSSLSLRLTNRTLFSIMGQFFSQYQKWFWTSIYLKGRIHLTQQNTSDHVWLDHNWFKVTDLSSVIKQLTHWSSSTIRGRVRRRRSQVRGRRFCLTVKRLNAILRWISAGPTGHREHAALRYRPDMTTGPSVLWILHIQKHLSNLIMQQNKRADQVFDGRTLSGCDQLIDRWVVSTDGQPDCRRWNSHMWWAEYDSSDVEISINKNINT